MIYQWVCNMSNTTGTTGEIGTAYPSEYMSSSPVFARSVGLYILFAHHCVSFCPLSYGHCIISSSC
jgi:hypothetical protein